MGISVCIFARNEQRLLPACLGALDAAGLGPNGQVHILVNGCADNTAAVAKALSAVDPRVTVHELPVGDKANAWNEYIHRISDPSIDAHVFTDGDVRASVGALTALTHALAQAPQAYGAAALPVSGRSRRNWSVQLLTRHYLSGNLYALSASAIAAFRAQKVRLPYGAKGEDGLVAYLLLTDLKGGVDDSYVERLVTVETATFEFESLKLNQRDLRIYHRRLRRYSERHFQKFILYGMLKKHGVSALPDTISEIYTPEAVATLHPRLDPVNFWYDLAVLRRLRNTPQAALVEYFQRNKLL